MKEILEGGGLPITNGNDIDYFVKHKRDLDLHEANIIEVVAHFTNFFSYFKWL